MNGPISDEIFEDILDQEANAENLSQDLSNDELDLSNMSTGDPEDFSLNDTSETLLDYEPLSPIKDNENDTFENNYSQSNTLNVQDLKHYSPKLQKIAKGVVQGSPRNTQKIPKSQKEMAPDNPPLKES